ncbi:MAG: 5-formyltetrahydrofolate cyclo-ligase [Fibrobacterota bacterium]
MDSIGFQEILLIGVLVLILFGPKGMGGIMREMGRAVGKMKKYRDEFSREIMAMSEPVLTEEQIRGNERKRIRKTCRSAMDDMPAEQRTRESGEIHERLFALPEYQNARRLFCYVSLDTEADTRRILRAALDQGRELFVPACRPADKTIALAQIRDPETDLVPGMLKILEPRPERIAVVDPLSLDLFIIPGVAFDNDGNRLGRGAGYFDRFLKGIKGQRPIAALALSVQVYPYSIPTRPHDIRPDKIMTPYSIIEEKPCPTNAPRAETAPTTPA